MRPLSQRWDICPNDGTFVRRNVMPLLLLLWDSETAVPAKKVWKNGETFVSQYWDICHTLKGHLSQWWDFCPKECHATIVTIVGQWDSCPSKKSLKKWWDFCLAILGHLSHIKGTFVPMMGLLSKGMSCHYCYYCGTVGQLSQQKKSEKMMRLLSRNIGTFVTLIGHLSQWCKNVMPTLSLLWDSRTAVPLKNFLKKKWLTLLVEM